MKKKVFVNYGLVSFKQFKRTTKPLYELNLNNLKLNWIICYSHIAIKKIDDIKCKYKLVIFLISILLRITSVPAVVSTAGPRPQPPSSIGFGFGPK